MRHDAVESFCARRGAERLYRLTAAQSPRLGLASLHPAILTMTCAQRAGDRQLAIRRHAAGRLWHVPGVPIGKATTAEWRFALRDRTHPNRSARTSGGTDPVGKSSPAVLTMLLTPTNWFRSRRPRSNGCTGTATSQRCRSPRFGASCGLLKAPTASAKPSPGTAMGDANG